MKLKEGIQDLDIMRWNPINRPLFWMHEQTGMMEAIVNKFFKQIHLTNLEMKYLRWYIVQWIDGIVSQVKVGMTEQEFKEYVKNAVPKEYKRKLDGMDQEQITIYVAGELLNYGMDPF